MGPELKWVGWQEGPHWLKRLDNVVLRVRIFIKTDYALEQEKISVRVAAPAW